MKTTAKVMMAITLTTAFGMSVCMEPADAKRPGNNYSKTGSDAASIEQQFRLVDTTQDGSPITEDETTKGDPNVGLFKDAIENYADGGGRFCSLDSLNPSTPIFDQNCVGKAGDDYSFRDSDGERIVSRPFIPSTIPVDGDLTAQYFPGGIDDPFKAQDGYLASDVIAYSIFKEGEAEPTLSFRLFVDDLVKLDPSNNRDTTVYKAVNDLEYILNKNLLGSTETFGVTTPDTGLNKFGYNNSGKGELQKDIPEPDTRLGILAALGVVSTGTLLKRKVKQR